MKSKVEYTIRHNSPSVEELIELEENITEFNKSSKIFETWLSVFNKCLKENSIIIDKDTIMQLNEKLNTKAMFANGYHEEVEEDFDDDFGDVHCEDDDCELGVKVDWNDLEDDVEDEHKVCPKCHKEPCECLHEDDESLEEDHAKTGHIKLGKPVELKARDNK